MKIAVTYEEGQVFQHFGHTQEMMIYTVEDGKVTDSQVVSTEGSGHSALAGFIKGLGADSLICGGIGFGARQALEESGIKLYAGVSGSADQAVQSLLAGELTYSSDATCDHHHEDGHHDCHGGEGHHHGGHCHHGHGGHDGCCH